MRNVRALFLDRDGVINVDTNYPYLPEHITFIEGIFDLCRAANEKKYLIIVVTNQAGIGRGYYTEDDFHSLMAWMQAKFRREKAPITGYYHCPYHPEHGIGPYKRDSFDRKPNPGMLLKAQLAHGIDMLSSIMIGDRESDIRAGNAAGIGKTFYMPINPDIQVSSNIISSLKEVIEHL